MARSKFGPSSRFDDATAKLAEHITRIVNLMFGRRLRTSKALQEALQTAIEAGYTEDDLRVMPWIARCLSGEVWIKSAIARDLAPEILYRFHGGTNPKTGQPARRWLDELGARIDETDPDLIGSILRKMPDDMRAEEKAMLNRMKVAYDESA